MSNPVLSPKKALFVEIIKGLVAERDKQTSHRIPWVNDGRDNEKLQRPYIFKRHGEVNLLQANLMFAVYKLYRRAQKDNSMHIQT